MNPVPAKVPSCSAARRMDIRALVQPVGIGLILLLFPIVLRFLGGHSLFLRFTTFIASIQDSPYGIVSSALVYLMAGGLCVALGVPRLWVSAGAGAVFNPWLGTVVALGASLMGAATLFQVGWWFLSSTQWPFLEKRLGTYRRAFQKRAFMGVLYARLFPFCNSTLVSLFSGYCRIDFTAYLGASFIGFLPLTLVMCLLGGGSISGRRIYFLMGFLLIIFLHILTLRIKKRLTPRPDGNPGPSVALVFKNDR